MSQFRKVMETKRTVAPARGVGTYRISGESVTKVQIAERLGITVVQAESRMRTEAQRPASAGPITWERLQR